MDVIKKILLTLKHSNNENGKVIMTRRKEQNVANFSTHPTACGFAEMKIT